MSKQWRPNKELDKECEVGPPKKSFHTFKKPLTKRDFNRMDREKKEIKDEIDRHVREHSQQVTIAQQRIADGYKLVYTHPKNHYMTFQHPTKSWERWTLNGEDNVSELYGWLRQYGMNYGIYV